MFPPRSRPRFACDAARHRLASVRDDSTFQEADGHSRRCDPRVSDDVTSAAFDGSRPNPPVGYYTYTVADDSWTWSDGMFVLHGFAPNEVPATTAVLLHHKHPDDRTRAYQRLEHTVATGEPFSCYHRIIDRSQRVRSVLSVGRAVKGPAGDVERVVGFFIDLTEVRREEVNAEVEVALVRIAEHRSVIEQAKGMLMADTGCDPDAAFDMLRRRSQTVNVKVHQVAHQLVAAARERAAERGGLVASLLADLGAQPSRGEPVNAEG